MSSYFQVNYENKLCEKLPDLFVGSKFLQLKQGRSYSFSN
jgi:hypothetical protein